MFFILFICCIVTHTTAGKLTDYCNLLGVTSDSLENEIRRAFRVKSKPYHPDSKPHNIKNAKEKYNEFVQARDFLLGINIDPTDREARNRWSDLSEKRSQRHTDELNEMNRKSKEWYKDFFGEDLDEVMKKRRANSSNNNQSTNSDKFQIKTLEEQIETALKNLQGFDVDIYSYLKNLQQKYQSQKHTNDNEKSSKVMALFTVLLVSVVFSIVVNLKQKSPKERLRNDIEKILSESDAENIQIRILRNVIRQNKDWLGYIKTTGKGRTKLNIIRDLSQFLKANYKDT